MTNLEPMDDRASAKVAQDETGVKNDGERYQLAAAVNPETNVTHHDGLYPTRKIATTKMLFRERNDKHTVEGAEFFVDRAPWLQVGLFELGRHFRLETQGDRNPVEYVFQDVRCRDNHSTNMFNNADQETVESCLLAYAWPWNQVI